LAARSMSQASAQQESASELSLSSYAALLDSYAAQISKARRQPAELARIRESVPSQWIVRAGRMDVSVSTEWFTTAVAELADRPKEADTRAREIVQRLFAMRDAAEQLGQSSAAPSDARTRLDAIFQQGEFSSLHGPTELQILEARISRWIAAQLFKLFARLHLGTKAGNIFSWSVIGIAFLLLCWWLWRRFAVLAPAAEPQAVPQIAAASSRRWLEEAFAAADRGDYREAVHCAYWAAVARLEDSGHLKRDRARTPREALRQIASHPQEREILGALTRALELVWYGYHPASDAEWNGARNQLENIGCLKRSTAATATS
jgi:hypothetical protein